MKWPIHDLYTLPLLVLAGIVAGSSATQGCTSRGEPEALAPEVPARAVDKKVQEAQHPGLGAADEADATSADETPSSDPDPTQEPHKGESSATPPRTTH